MPNEVEIAYDKGSRAALTGMLRSLTVQLSGEERDLAALLIEREDTVAKLRDVCERFGDNEWPDNLHLADVIEKHLLRHLEAPLLGGGSGA